MCYSGACEWELYPSGDCKWSKGNPYPCEQFEEDDLETEKEIDDETDKI